MRLLVLCALLWAVPAVAQVRLPETFRLGYLSERVEFSVQYMAPALALFRKQLAPYGVKDVQLEVAPSIEQMAEMVRSGRVDMFISTPFPVLRTARIAGVRPVLCGIPLRPKHAAFFVRRDSPVKTLADLDGKKLAFTITYSSPGFFVPILHLLKAGFVLNRAAPGKKVVYTSLSGHNINSMYWLYFNRCDAVAVGDDDLRKVSPKLQAAVRELEVTATYPGFFVLMASTWTPAQAQLMISYLSHMHQDPAGQDLLNKTYGCRELAPISPDVARWIAEADTALSEMESAHIH